MSALVIFANARTIVVSNDKKEESNLSLKERKVQHAFQIHKTHHTRKRVTTPSHICYTFTRVI